jgi:hypothetical protein
VLAASSGNESNAAYHEAGHCVVAHILGEALGWSTIDPDKAFGRPGATHWTSEPVTKTEAKRRIVSLLAGFGSGSRRNASEVTEVSDAPTTAGGDSKVLVVDSSRGRH